MDILMVILVKSRVESLTLLALCPDDIPHPQLYIDFTTVIEYAELKGTHQDHSV